MVYKFLITKLKTTLQKRGNKALAEAIFSKVCKLIFESTQKLPFDVINQAIYNGFPLLLLREDKGKKQRQTDKYIMPVLIKNENTRIMFSVC